MASIAAGRSVPHSGPKRLQADEEEMQTHAVAKAEAVRARAADRLYKSAVQQNRKKKQVSQTYTPPNCTFKPKLAASGRRRQSAVAGKKPAHERMYQQAKEAQQKKKDVRKKLSDPKNFKPKMASKSTRTKLKSKSEDFLSRLAKDGAARKAREKKIKQVQEKSLDLQEQGYTFQPALSKKAKSVRAPSPMQRVTNYKKQAAEKEAKRRALQAKYELQNCSFRPQMKRSKSAPKSRQGGSFLQRQQENEARAKAHMNRLLLEKEESLRKAETFKPAVKVKAQHLRSQDERTAHERLYESGAAKLRTRKLASQNKPLDSECTFKPKVQRSKSAPRARTTTGPIHDRLYEEMARQKEFAKQAKERREAEIRKTCSFKPKLNKNKNVGAAASTNSDEPIWDRLNIEKDKKDRIAKEKEKRKTDRELAACTFKPEVKYHPAHETYEDEPIWERLHAEPIGFSAEEPTGADQETFQPQINDLSEQLVGNQRADEEPIHERLFSIDVKAKEREREEEKAKRELAACTFKPERASAKNKEVAPPDDGDDVFERLVTRDTESLAARRSASPPSNGALSARGTPNPRTPGGARRSTGGSRGGGGGGGGGGGLSFLERMAQASAKQKSAHNTPRPASARGGGGSAVASPAPKNIVRQVKRPTPQAARNIPKATSSGHEATFEPARGTAAPGGRRPVPRAAAAPRLPAAAEDEFEPEAYEAAGGDGGGSGGGGVVATEDEDEEDEEEFEEDEEEEEEEEDDEDAEDGDDATGGGGGAPLEF